jgi:hypothetical protein
MPELVRDDLGRILYADIIEFRIRHCCRDYLQRKPDPLDTRAKPMKIMPYLQLAYILLVDYPDSPRIIDASLYPRSMFRGDTLATGDIDDFVYTI